MAMRAVLLAAAVAPLLGCQEPPPARVGLLSGTAEAASVPPPATLRRAPIEPDEEIEPDEPGPELGEFQITFYWIALEADFPGVADTDVYDQSCDVLATVPAAFAKSLRMEGTGALLDGRILNVARCACAVTPCFVEVGPLHPFGIGVEDRPLVPFRSVAVDPNVIPIGTTLHVRELAGLRMPGDPPWGGFVHDGCVVADDRGGNIDGRQLDFFVVQKDHYRELTEGRLRRGVVTVSLGGRFCRP